MKDFTYNCNNVNVSEKKDAKAQNEENKNFSYEYSPDLDTFLDPLWNQVKHS